MSAVPAIALVGLLAAAAPASDAANRAEELFRAERYEEAAAAFAEAYAAEPEPYYAYAQGQAARKAGDCETAIEAYRSFLDSGPPEDEEVKARALIQQCQEQLDEQAAANPDADEGGDEALPVEPDGPVDEPRDKGARPWHRDPLGGVLLGIGLVSAGAGAGLLGFGLSDRKNARDANSEGEFEDRLDRDETLANVGIGLLATGGALLVGAAVRYVVVARRARVQAAPTAWLGGGGVVIVGRF